MGAHLNVATHTLFSQEGLQAINIKLFPGTNRDVTVEQMAEQVSKAIAQIENGDFDAVESFDD